MKISVKTKKIILIAVAVILLAGVVCGSYFGSKELNKSNYYSIERKASRLIKNEEVFADSLYSVLNGNTDNLEILSVENGTVNYNTNDILKKRNVKSVAGKNGVIDYSLDTSFYESGYLYCENVDNLFPVHIDDEALAAEEYTEQEDGTLVKGSYKDIKSDSAHWLVVKQINDNWYYYEYHN